MGGWLSGREQPAHLTSICLLLSVSFISLSFLHCAFLKVFSNCLFANMHNYLTHWHGWLSWREQPLLTWHLSFIFCLFLKYLRSQEVSQIHKSTQVSLKHTHHETEKNTHKSRLCSLFSDVLIYLRPSMFFEQVLPIYG